MEFFILLALLLAGGVFLLLGFLGFGFGVGWHGCGGCWMAVFGGNEQLGFMLNFAREKK